MQPGHACGTDDGGVHPDPAMLRQGVKAEDVGDARQAVLDPELIQVQVGDVGLGAGGGKGV